MNDFWIILTASLVSCCCALLGCYLILRKMALVGDAISHAVLPGIVIAYLVSGSRDSISMLIGAASLGLVTTFLIEFLHKKAKLQSDAAIGITFTWLFAIGVVMISLFAGKVDLDQDCVLYGEIAYTPLDTITLIPGLLMIPKSAIVLFGLLVVILLVLTTFFKQLLITSFDPGYASALGLSSAVWHYALMALVSTTTVASFESVGAILVIALLIVPAATAYLLTDSFISMLILACLAGIIASISGYYMAVWLDGSIAAAIATCSGLLFTLVFVFSPTQGLLRRKSLPIIN
jgi:manganese/zinc/iron transport system permease protein